MLLGGIVVVAAVASAFPLATSSPAGGVGRAPRIAVGAGPTAVVPIPEAASSDLAAVEPDAAVDVNRYQAPWALAGYDGGAGASIRLTWYTVKAGDTLYDIAAHYHLRLSTVMWANGLTGTLIHIGQVLRLPPADGTLLTVTAEDTLESIAAASGVDAADIADFNGLAGRRLVPGEVLLIPGGAGPAISLPTPTPRPTTRPTPRAATAVGCSSCGFKPLLWPVPGGQISQYFGCTGFWAEPAFGDCAHFHGGIDIWAPTGTPILAAAGGTVTIAGWTSGGGGNEVCIDDGGGYTTCYHHLASIATSTGQVVGRGQLLGGVGSTGNSTGPHLHFEIWIGPVWNGGYRVDPLDYF